MVARRLSATVLALLATPHLDGGSFLPAQSPRTVQLDANPVRSGDGFGSIVGIAELPDGRVVVGDSKERLIRLVDFGTGTVVTLGRPGDGPGEYRGVSSVVMMPGDTSLVHDAIGQRALLISPQGSIVRSEALPASLRRGNGMTGSFQFADAHGRLYYATEALDVRVVSPAADGAIVRWTPWQGAPEQVGSFSPRLQSEVLNALVPFVHRDAWAVRYDGLVARVHADTYRVTWYRDGREQSRTAELPAPRIPISVRDCQAHKDSVLAGPAGGVGPREGSATPGGTPDGLRARWAQCPAFRPPIAAHRNAARFDALGHLWVERERPRGDPVAVFDVIGEGRGLVRQVALPAGRRLLGLTARWIYLAATDGDGFEWLERYPRPLD